MADRCYAKVGKIFRRKLDQNRDLNIVGAKCSLILGQSNVAQPLRDVQNQSPTIDTVTVRPPTCAAIAIKRLDGERELAQNLPNSGGFHCPTQSESATGWWQSSPLTWKALGEIPPNPRRERARARRAGPVVLTWQSFGPAAPCQDVTRLVRNACRLEPLVDSE